MRRGECAEPRKALQASCADGDGDAERPFKERGCYAGNKSYGKQGNQDNGVDDHLPGVAVVVAQAVPLTQQQVEQYPQIPYGPGGYHVRPAEGETVVKCRSSTGGAQRQPLQQHAGLGKCRSVE